MDTIERPTWLTDDLFLEILREDFENPQELHVIAVTVERGTGKGENYSSNIYRATVEYHEGAESRVRRFIVKADLTDTPFEDMINDYKMGDLESNCYRHVIPKVQELMKSIGEDCEIAPKCLKANVRSRPRYLILEDLKERNYLNVNRKIGLDVPHLELVVKKLAKWHAATARLVEIDPEIYERHNVRALSKEVTHFHPFFINAVKSCGEAVSKWAGCEKYGEQLLKMVDTTIEKGCSVFDRDERDFNVLTHSDLWMNNIMFRYEGSDHNKPLDALFVDFAGGYHGSFALDLAYLLFTSNVETNTERDWDHLIRVYHRELARLLALLDYQKKIPTLIDIHVGLLQKPHLALILAIFVIPVRLVEDTKDADLSGFIGDEPEKIEFRKNLFNLPKYRNFLEPVLDYCYRKGILEP